MAKPPVSTTDDAYFDDRPGDIRRYGPAQPGDLGITVRGLAKGPFDVIGETIDLAAGASGIASKLNPTQASFSPVFNYLASVNPAFQQLSNQYGGPKIGDMLLGTQETDRAKSIEDDARLVGSLVGAAEAATAKGAGFLGRRGKEGIEAFTKFLNFKGEAVTPDGQVINVPPTTDLPDTSVVRMSGEGGENTNILRDKSQPPFTVEEGQFPKYDFTNSAPEGSDQVKGFMSAFDMIHKPTGTRIPADSNIRGHEPDFEKAPGIPDFDSETARRVLMGEISLDDARKELVRKSLRVVEPAPPPNVPMMITWHGSGKDFDKFSLSYIGTGEGNQMYGHGLYLSDLREVGQGYKDRIGFRPALEIGGDDTDAQYYLGNFNYSRKNVFVDEDGTEKVFVPEDDEYADVIEELDNIVGSDNTAINLGQSNFVYQFDDGTALKVEYNRERVDETNGRLTGGVFITPLDESEGKLMEVGMRIDPRTEMIDYYQTLDTYSPEVIQKLKSAVDRVLNSEPPEAFFTPEGDLQFRGDTDLSVDFDNVGMLEDINDVLDRMIAGDTSAGQRADGQGVLMALSKAVGEGEGDSPEISKVLNESGIKATRYYTAGTRGKNLEDYERSYNYVVFDDATLEIMKKYGLIGPFATAAGAKALMDSQSPTDQEPQMMAQGGVVNSGIAEFVPYMVR